MVDKSNEFFIEEGGKRTDEALHAPLLDELDTVEEVALRQSTRARVSAEQNFSDEVLDSLFGKDSRLDIEPATSSEE